MYFFDLQRVFEIPLEEKMLLHLKRWLSWKDLMEIKPIQKFW